MITVKLETIEGAEYNPRKIKDDCLKNLQDSIRDLGVIKAIIVNENNNIIVAGHQRTKAMKSMGITECPAFLLNNLQKADEYRFNQFHNSCDIEMHGDAPIVKINAELQKGFNLVKPEQIEIVENGQLISRINALTKLLIKYGEFSNAIATKSGNVLVDACYARACKLANVNLRVFAVDDDKEELVKFYFKKNYGEFCYKNLPKQTYAQGLAQLFRLRKRRNGTISKSNLYTKIVIPFLEKQDINKFRILDFGCGQGDYVKYLKNKNYNIHGVDPYATHNRQYINVSENKKNFEKVIRDLTTFGQYDCVICDSVLNSVDCTEAEQSVLYTLYGLCKNGGTVCVSGRMIDRIMKQKSMKNNAQYQDGNISFLDENNFSAIFRNGYWFYQKYHTKDELGSIIEIYGNKTEKQYRDADVFGLQITKTNTNIDENKVVKALQYEFDMILENGERYNLREEIKDAYINRKSTGN